jgi:hypothetical protein
MEPDEPDDEAVALSVIRSHQSGATGAAPDKKPEKTALLPRTPRPPHTR